MFLECMIPIVVEDIKLERWDCDSVSCLPSLAPFPCTNTPSTFRLSVMSRNHTALAYQPKEGSLHPSVSPELARAFDGFFGPPAREQGSAPTSPDRTSVDASLEYRPRDSQVKLPTYSVFGGST